MNRYEIIWTDRGARGTYTIYCQELNVINGGVIEWVDEWSNHHFISPDIWSRVDQVSND